MAFLPLPWVTGVISDRGTIGNGKTNHIVALSLTSCMPPHNSAEPRCMSCPSTALITCDTPRLLCCHHYSQLVTWHGTALWPLIYYYSLSEADNNHGLVWMSPQSTCAEHITHQQTERVTAYWWLAELWLSNISRVIHKSRRCKN